MLLRWPVDPIRASTARILPETTRIPVVYEMKWDGPPETLMCLR